MTFGATIGGPDDAQQTRRVQLEPEVSRKRLGAYLLLTSPPVNVVTSAIFVTAMSANSWPSPRLPNSGSTSPDRSVR